LQREETCLHKSKFVTIALATLATFFALSIILFPREALDASIKGLNTWWKIVFPALLPFFIVAELLIGFGVVKFIGVLLEPLMRPIFRVPGVGGFVWAMGIASGNPAGAKFTVRLRQDNQITKTEAERLVAFTSGANPLFIFGAVSVGFFNNTNLGIILAISHYSANILVGLIMRFYGKDDDAGKEKKSRFSIVEAFRALHQTRVQEQRPFGKLMGDAVISSINTLLMIGGFIILFSVFNRILSLLQITKLFSVFIEFLFALVKLPEVLSIPFISGLFEMTIGSQMISETAGVSLLKQSVVVSFLLAFGGFSIQAQVASLLAQSDIRFLPFFLARLLQGIFAALITLLIWRPLYEDSFGFESLVPVFLTSQAEQIGQVSLLLSEIGPIVTIISLLVYIMVSLPLGKEKQQ